jgi:hypothetical protein
MRYNDLMTTRDTRASVKAWLDENYRISEGETECILAQDGWKFLGAHTERYAGMAFEPGPEAWAEAHEFALSALVECHDAPHIAACPYFEETA